MQVIDGREVQVLLVPAEEGLPRADVAVGVGDASDLAVDGVLEDGVQRAEIPGSGLLIHEGAEQVCAVKGRREDDILPELDKKGSTMSST